MELTRFLLIIGAFGGSVGIVRILFRDGEEVWRDDQKKRLSDYIMNADPGARAQGLVEGFITWFDKIFGERHLRFRCFFVSSLASTASFAVVLAIYSAIDPGLWEPFTGTFGNDGQSLLWAPIMLFVLVAVFNFVPDYISLLETRFMLKHMATRKHTGSLLLFMMLDAFATAGIFFLIAPIMMTLLDLAEGERVTLASYIYYVELLTRAVFGFEADNPTEENILFRLYAFTTFFTSIWLWLFLLVSLFARIAHGFGRVLNIFRRYFDFENKPLQSLGYIIYAGLALFFLIVTVVVAIRDERPEPAAEAQAPMVQHVGSQLAWG